MLLARGVEASSEAYRGGNWTGTFKFSSLMIVYDFIYKNSIADPRIRNSELKIRSPPAPETCKNIYIMLCLRTITGTA